MLLHMETFLATVVSVDACLLYPGGTCNSPHRGQVVVYRTETQVVIVNQLYMDAISVELSDAIVH